MKKLTLLSVVFLTGCVTHYIHPEDREHHQFEKLQDSWREYLPKDARNIRDVTHTKQKGYWIIFELEGKRILWNYSSNGGGLCVLGDAKRSIFDDKLDSVKEEYATDNKLQAHTTATP